MYPDVRMSDRLARISSRYRVEIPEKRLTTEETLQLLRSVESSATDFLFDEKKQSLVFKSTDSDTWELTLPIVLPKISGDSLKEIRAQIEQAKGTYTIILIQAGSAALAYYEREALSRHKVIKKYMIRKKQGKSQINHLKSKGKSRYGSRVRLQNTVLFFEEINATLQKWNVSQNSETILMSLPVNLKSLLFSSKIPVPFDKKDPRIKRVPIDVRVPTFKELKHINWMVTRGSCRPRPTREQ